MENAFLKMSVEWQAKRLESKISGFSFFR